MSILITLLTIVEVLVCLLLILLIMMQRPRQEGLGAAFGSGVTDQMWGAQTTNVLQKGTVWLAAAMFITTVALAALVSKQTPKSDKKLFETPAVTAAAAKPAEAKPAAVNPAEAKPAATTGPALKLNAGSPTTSPVIKVEPPKTAEPAKLPSGSETIKPKANPSVAKPAPAPSAAAQPAPVPAPSAPPAPAKQP